MEDEDKAPVTRVQQMSSAAFDVLKEKGVSKCTLEISEDQLQDEIDDKTKALIKNAVFAAYFRYSHQLSNDDIFAATNAAIETLCVIQSQPPDNKPIPELRELAPKSFQQDYKGNADISFQRYLAGCCYAYFNHGNEEMYTAPYVTITQSSGFGKSRILKRLAEKENLKHGNVSFDTKVLKDPMEELQKHPTVPVLVVAIDEARALLTKRNSNGDNTFRTLRRALRNVNTTATSYTDSTLHGVSSLFCRIGLRPYASSPIVTRLVADFMSVLHYVGYKNDTHVSGYVSEPILTFGATRMWYQFEDPTTNSPSALESDILPQLKTMLLNGLIDTGNIGELVVRIFLLLAMDAVAMGSSEKRDFVFSGEFCGVVKFVNMLVGKNPYRKERGKMKSYKDWLEDWNGWQICFSHFVDLQEEPTENVLWKLLDRRAAGTFPRGQRGADLLIPIFRPKCDSYPEGKVSFIVVQVKDDKFPDSALRKLSCSYVFKEANTLSKLKNHEVIRLYIQVKCDLKSRDDYEKRTKQNRLSSVLSADDAEKTASHTLKFASKVKAQ
eukprot:jgi/Phyca11/18435/fgenesh1_pg.PHYCAscaffold_36_\